ncbi:MAG: zinc-ribbon domain-containing protein, partial [Gemmatimonadetes bacterium]|nr:zinc-ribbon domain-containing protein [Gemmatimonadota bacterium]
MNCASCGALLGEGVAFCESCGTPAPPPQPGVCGNCGTPLEPGMAFCVSCGAAVAGGAPGSTAPRA